MSELLTQSRPYAEAIFEIAKDEKSLDVWVDDLSKVVTAMQEESVRTLINSPDLSQRNKAEIFVSLFADEISKKVSNFVLVIGQANRLRLLEKVLENFKNLVALEKNQKNVTVASSFSLDQDHEILNGIVRQVLLDCAADLGLKFEERPFSLKEAMSAKECFSTASTMSVFPVVEIDGHKIGTGKPGEVAKTLSAAYDAIGA